MPVAEKLAQSIMNGQETTPVFETLVAHINEHANRAQEQGAPKDQLKPVLEFLAQAGPAIAKMHAMDQQAEQLKAQSAAHDAEGQQIMDAAGSPPAEVPQ
jgi:hypothetical protein